MLGGDQVQVNIYLENQRSQFIMYPNLDWVYPITYNYYVVSELQRFQLTAISSSSNKPDVKLRSSLAATRLFSVGPVK